MRPCGPRFYVIKQSCVRCICFSHEDFKLSSPLVITGGEWSKMSEIYAFNCNLR